MTQRHPVQFHAIVMVTTVTKHRMPIFADAACAREAVECLYRTKAFHPFFLHAFVVMPDHMHVLLHTIPPVRVSDVIRAFKSGVAHDMGMGPIWQERFHMRVAEDPYVLREYIHRNPVAGGLVDTPSSYHWSSASGLWRVDPMD